MRLLDGTRRPEDVCRDLAALHGIRCAPPVIHRFIGQLGGAGLLEGGIAADARPPRFERRGLLCMIRLVHPDALARRATARLRLVGHPLAPLGAATLIAVAAVLTATHLADIGEQLARAWTGPGVAVALGLALLSALVHESSHALAASWFGARLVSAGVGAYYFRPCLFCEIRGLESLARWKRLVVSCAGVAIDTIQASVCVIASRLLPAGTTADVLLLTALLLGVRVFINLNPLLKLDGYHLLVDLTGQRDLREAAFRALASALRDLGVFVWRGAHRSPGRPELAHTLYGLLAVAYLVGVVAPALVAFHGWLRATVHDGDLIVATLVVLALAGRTSRTLGGNDRVAQTSSSAAARPGRSYWGRIIRLAVAPIIRLHIPTWWGYIRRGSNDRTRCRSCSGPGEGHEMNRLLQDLRHACRTLTSAPGTAAFAILTFAAAIGGNTAFFSLVNAWVLRPLPYDHPDRLVAISERRVAEHGRRTLVAPADFLDWRENAETFEALAAYHLQTSNLTRITEPEQVEATRVSANFFSVLGVRAASGRTFHPGEEAPGAGAVAIASHGFWQRRFGAAPFAPRTITLDDRTVEIVGVMPPSFEFPKGSALWVPMILEPGLATLRRIHYLQVVGRLRPGISIESAQRAMDAQTGRLEREFSENRGHHSMIVSLTDEMLGTLRMPLLLLQAAVGFVLLLACANIATLLLARGAGRQFEIAVRLALGAGRLRVLRQLLLEGLMLAALGGVAGVVAALWLTPLLRDLVPEALRPAGDVAADSRVLAFAVGITAVAGVLAALAPSLHASAADPARALKLDQATASGLRRLRLTSVLVASEVALAVVLLVGAGLTLKSFARLHSTDPGFRAEGVLTTTVSLPRSRYRQSHQIAAFYQHVLDRLRSLPDVSAAGGVLTLPGAGNFGRRPFTIEKREARAEERPSSLSNIVTRDYFRAMGIPLLQGRAFADGDANGPAVVIVNESWVRRYLADGDPLGTVVRFSGTGGADTRAAIVGVIGDVRQSGMATAPEPEIYHPHSQISSSRLTLAVRTSGPGVGAADVRGAIWSVDRDQTISNVERMEAIFERDLAEPRLRAALLSTFAGGAIGLAVIGLVGLASSTVRMRVAEIAIRIALGAQPSDISRLVVLGALRWLAIGAGTGTVLALWLTQLTRGLFRNVAPADPVVFGVVLALLAACGILASYAPARRAARLDPIVAMRGASGLQRE